MRDGENGLLAPPDGPALRARLVAGGWRTLAEHLDGNVLTERTLDLYRAVIAARGRADV